ncbi:MAG: tetratricopeptide repeat protein [Planctomycetota bacterium]
MGKIGDTVRKGLFAPIKALLPKNPWLRVLVYALPIVLLLALFGPALEVLLKVVDLFVRVLEPILQTTVGRIIVLLVVLSVLGLLAFWLLKNRVRTMRAEATLGRHLQATAALVGLDRDRSRELFRKVTRYRGSAPQRYPHVVADANLKLARLCLEDSQIDEALGHLQRCVETGLPKELQRSLLQLRLQALQRQGQVLPATLQREAEEAAKRFGDDVFVLSLLRDLAEREDRHEEALEWQAKVARHAQPSRRVAESQRYHEMLLGAGRRALENDDPDGAKKLAKRLQKADPEGTAAALLLGDVHRKNKELHKAVREYGSTRSPTGLDRIAELLTEHPGSIEPRDLLANCPMQGALLLVARELARAGEHERAERAARVAADSLGPTPTVCAVLAEVLDLLGEGQKAQLLREQTVVRLLAAPSA